MTFFRKMVTQPISRRQQCILLEQRIFLEPIWTFCRMWSSLQLFSYLSYLPSVTATKYWLSLNTKPLANLSCYFNPSPPVMTIESEVFPFKLNEKSQLYESLFKSNLRDPGAETYSYHHRNNRAEAKEISSCSLVIAKAVSKIGINQFVPTSQGFLRKYLFFFKVVNQASDF